MAAAATATAVVQLAISSSLFALRVPASKSGTRASYWCVARVCVRARSFWTRETDRIFRDARDGAAISIVGSRSSVRIAREREEVVREREARQGKRGYAKRSHSRRRRGGGASSRRIRSVAARRRRRRRRRQRRLCGTSSRRCETSSRLERRGMGPVDRVRESGYGLRRPSTTTEAWTSSGTGTSRPSRRFSVS